MKLDFRGTPHPGMQTRILDALRATDAKYVLLTAPVGSGKSYIGMAAARGAESAFIVSTQNILLDQYGHEFEDVPMVKGRSQYDCQWATGEARRSGDYNAVNCEQAHDKYAQNEQNTANEHSLNCTDYISARDAFWDTPISVTNMHFLMFAHPSKNAKSPNRSLLVIDECHNLESVLLDLAHFDVLQEDCKRLSVSEAAFSGVQDRDGDLRDLFVAYQAKALHLADEDGKAKKLPAISADEVQRKRILNTAHKMEGVTSENRWHFDRVDPGVITAKPLFARGLTRGIFSRVDKVLFMSATPGTPAHFFRDFGIQESETDAVEEPSDWPLGNIRVVVGRDNKATNLPQNLPWLADKCATIMRSNSKHKGMIALASYQLQLDLYELLKRKFGERLICHTPETRGDAVSEHCDSDKPTVLMGVNMHEGLDLKGDLARFLIIPKVLREAFDGWNTKRDHIDAGYYNRKTIARMVQACGRVVRSSTDRADIYILDTGFVPLLLDEDTCTEFPLHFRESCELVQMK